MLCCHLQLHPQMSCLQGADVNKADARGITALGLAVGYNKVPLVKVLIEGGADVSKTDAKGSTVLHYAAGMLNT